MGLVIGGQRHGLPATSLSFRILIFIVSLKKDSHYNAVSQFDGIESGSDVILPQAFAKGTNLSPQRTLFLGLYNLRHSGSRPYGGYFFTQKPRITKNKIFSASRQKMEGF